MEWIILFILNWMLFLTLIEWKSFKTNVWSGIGAVSMQLFVDTQFISHEFYRINNPMVDILGSSGFFIAGPVFVIGVLLAQFYPRKRWARVCHLLVLTAMFSLQELFLIKRGALDYINWHHIDSLGVNLAAMGLLGWFSIVILKKGEDRLI